VEEKDHGKPHQGKVWYENQEKKLTNFLAGIFSGSLVRGGGETRRKRSRIFTPAKVKHPKKNPQPWRLKIRKKGGDGAYERKKRSCVSCREDDRLSCSNAIRKKKKRKKKSKRG